MIVSIRHINRPIAVHRNASRELKLCRAKLSVTIPEARPEVGSTSSQSCHHPAGRHHPNRMVISVRHIDIVVAVHRH